MLIYVCVYVYVYMYIDIDICVCTCIHTYLMLHARLILPCMMCASYVHNCRYVCVCIDVYRCRYVCVYMYTFVSAGAACAHYCAM